MVNYICLEHDAYKNISSLCRNGTDLDLVEGQTSSLNLAL